jgi:hypothetical protein
LRVTLEQGEAVSLHLPPDGLRVLAASRGGVEADAEVETEPEPA